MRFIQHKAEAYWFYRFLSLAPGEWEVAAIFEGRYTGAKIEIVAGEKDPVLDLAFPREP